MGNRAAAVVSRRVLLRLESDGARVLPEFGPAVQVRYRGDKGEFVFVGEDADKRLVGCRVYCEMRHAAAFFARYACVCRYTNKNAQE